MKASGGREWIVEKFSSSPFFSNCFAAVSTTFPPFELLKLPSWKGRKFHVSGGGRGEWARKRCWKKMMFSDYIFIIDSTFSPNFPELSLFCACRKYLPHFNFSCFVDFLSSSLSLRLTWLILIIIFRKLIFPSLSTEKLNLQSPSTEANKEGLDSPGRGEMGKWWWGKLKI